MGTATPVLPVIISSFMLDRINCCVIVPTYNNAKTLKRVLDGVLRYSSGRDVIVVNDGSTDGTAAVLAQYGTRLIVLGHSPNRGKGYALRKGFAEAIRRGFTYALTLDSDGQHLPDDIPVFMSGAVEHPGALLMGARDMRQDTVPAKSSFGNKFSNFWFWVETGISLPDTQTGFRLYPLEPLKKIRLFTTKFETEIEVIVKMAWRVSHFRPLNDFTRISILNTWFFLLTVLYYLPLRIIRKVVRVGLWNMIRAELFKPGERTVTKAASVGFGFFMGIVPIWGFQLLVGIPLAIWFRMNKVLFITAANISIPPMIPLIIYASYKIGGRVSPGRPVEFPSRSDLTLEAIHYNFLQYVTGGTVLAGLAGVTGFAVSYILFSWFRKKP